MRVIYVAGAYRGKTENEVYENITHARVEARKLWLEGYCVICPHLNSQFMGGSENADIFLQGGLELVKRSDDIYMLEGWKQSQGAVAEYELAQKLGLAVHYE